MDGTEITAGKSSSRISCKMLQIADGHNSGHTEVTAAGPERRRQLWREYNVGDYCRVSPDVMSRTCWRRESGENVRWTAERCQRGARTRAVISQQNDGTCSFLQAGPRIWGVWRQSIEQGKQGRFGQKQIYLDQKILDLDFVLECLRTALWCLYCGWWQSGSAEMENLGSPVYDGVRSR